ncbi:sensor histidine kinase [Phenylobacterium sp.]|uniref:sensor histidine kinase n=1 Tax=Phenylobacterium sp. TaxID=1871053 RepID=UPI002F937E9D
MTQDATPEDAPERGRLDDLIESVTDAFYAVDRDWRFVVFNRAAEEFFGLPREEMLGRGLWEVFPDGRERPFGQACFGAMERGEVHQMESPSAFRPGRVVELRVGPLRAGGVAVALRDVTERAQAQQRMREAEEHLRLMVLELNHRVKNNLATVQAIAVQTLRGAESPAEAREAFLRRITALAAAHDILTREQWEGVGVAEIAEGVLHALDGAGQRVKLDGPVLRLSPRAALSLSMAFHELGTNALKYGALSRPGGAVRLAWRCAGDPGMLEVDWEERGGPPVTPPASRGFGSRLLERGLAAELRGEVRMSFEPEGLRCAIRAPMEAAAA